MNIPKSKFKNESNNLGLLATYSLVSLGWTLANTIYSYKHMINSNTVDIELSNKVNSVLNTNNKYKVIVLKNVDELNAFAVGGDTVFISKKLHDLFNEDERIAILLHEISHVKSLDIYKQNILEKLIYIISLSGVNYTIKLKEQKRFVWLLPAAFIIWVYLFAFPIYKRHYEYKADKFASNYGYGKPSISALHKITEYRNRKRKENTKKNNTEMDKLEIILLGLNKLFSSHPTRGERIHKLLSYKENKNLSINDIKKNVEKELMEIKKKG